MQMILKDGKRKVLTLSYDDGVVQDKRFIKILDENGIRCTFNINSALYNNADCDGPRGRLTKKSAIELYKGSNHEVAIHGYTHPFLEKLDSAEVVYEITEDRKNIEQDYGVIARGMAYPYGTYSDDVVRILKDCGIAYARTTKATHNFKFPENWLTLHPTCHHRDKLMNDAKEFVEGPNRYSHPMLFYVWGHTYEFDDNNNWELIEEFAKYVGNRDDIWYATNIEIFEYLNAYNSLIFTNKGDIVYNPTSTEVFFVDSRIQKNYSVKPGEVKKLN